MSFVMQATAGEVAAQRMSSQPGTVYSGSLNTLDHERPVWLIVLLLDRLGRRMAIYEYIPSVCKSLEDAAQRVNLFPDRE